MAGEVIAEQGSLPQAPTPAVPDPPDPPDPDVPGPQARAVNEPGPAANGSDPAGATVTPDDTVTPRDRRLCGPFRFSCCFCHSRHIRASGRGCGGASPVTSPGTSACPPAAA